MSDENGKLTKVVIKKEHVCSNGDAIRLSSFAVPRDLTLGGASRGRGSVNNKKVFIPNLNVTRNKNANVKTAKDTCTNTSRSNRTDRGRGKGERGRGRGRGALLQTTGVFSEGAGGIGVKKLSSFRSSSNDERPSAIRRPTVFKKEGNIDISTAAADIKELFGDSDEDCEHENTDVNFVPLKISEVKWNCNVKVEKIEANDANLNTNSSDLREGRTDLASDLSSQKIPSTDPQNPYRTEDLTALYRQHFLIQFPDLLPLTYDISQDSPIPSTSADVSEDQTDKEIHRNETSIREMEEGAIGKMVRYKSGQWKLIIHGMPFDLDPGMDPGFLQDLMSIRTNSEERSGDISLLGSIRTKFTATPDWEDLFTTNVMNK